MYARASLLLYLFLITGLALPVFGEDRLVPKLRHKLEPMIPLPLRHLPLERTVVRALLEVDTEGRVTDLVIVEADHWGLVKRARNVLEDARFRPATRDEVPIATRFEFQLRLYEPGELGLAEVSLLDDIAQATLKSELRANAFGLRKPTELDAPLEVLDQGDQMFLPVDDEGATLNGKAYIRVYIDDQGHVRLPKLLRASDPRVGQAALQYIAQWRFAPPVCEGKPTVVEAVLPVRFREETSADTPQGA